jgi:hypothetical protein
MNTIETRTDFLFPKRSFWTGFSSILNIVGNPDKFNSSSSSQEADYKAIRSDWEMIGKDVSSSLSELMFLDYEQE